MSAFRRACGHSAEGLTGGSYSYLNYSVTKVARLIIVIDEMKIKSDLIVKELSRVRVEQRLL